MQIWTYLQKGEGMTEQAKRRRLQHMLTIAGGGVVAFCVWSLAKISLFLTLVDENTIRSLLGIGDVPLTTAIYVGLVAIIIIDLIVRAYVGMSARAEGRGKKKGPFYLIVAVLAAIANASSLVGIAFSTSQTLSPMNIVVSVAVEATAFATLALVVCSSIALRRMGKMAG